MYIYLFTFSNFYSLFFISSFLLFYFPLSFLFLLILYFIHFWFIFCNYYLLVGFIFLDLSSWICLLGFVCVCVCVCSELRMRVRTYCRAPKLSPNISDTRKLCFATSSIAWAITNDCGYVSELTITWFHSVLWNMFVYAAIA